jgi:sn-glycerol 3-phosphate transport system substrate-binding protein
METLQDCQQPFYRTESKLTMDLTFEARSNLIRRGPGPVGARRGTVFAACLVAGTLVTLSPPCARAETKVEFWHAMTGELRRELDRQVADFNRSQPDDRIVAIAKGSYTETVTSAIFAMRTRSHPAIVQVAEVATATMMAARGAIYPVFELMRKEGIAFDHDAFLPAISGYYSDLAGNLLSFPFNSSTPILYYNKDLFRAAGLDENAAPRTWPEVEAAARRLRKSGIPCGFTTHWPSWVNVENFSAFHDVPIATKANGLGGIDAALTINNPLMIRHVAALAEWQKTKLFDYSGREVKAQPRFPAGECGIFIGSSALLVYVKANSKFDVGYGMLPYWPDVAAAPQNSIIGGATLWVLRGRSDEEYKAVARFLAYLSRPEVQAAWHQRTGYLPVTQAAYELSRAQGFYEHDPEAAIAIEQINHKLPTENSRGLRLGSFGLIRDAIEDELELAFAGKKSAKAALDSAVANGDDLLRQFERATR